MKQKLTNAIVARAAAQAKPYQIHDTETRGLILRVQPSGRKFFKLIQRRRAVTIGEYPTWTLGMAREKARELLTGKTVQKKTPTLTEFIDSHYRDFVRANMARPEAALQFLLNTGFGNLPLDQIRVVDVEKYRQRRLIKGVTAASINRALGPLKAALQRAVEWDVLEANPLAKLKPLKVDSRPNVRYLSQDEADRLQEALPSAPPWFQVFVTLLLNTGCRRSELFNLKWSDISNGVLTVRGEGAKSGQTRHIPLNAKALAALDGWEGGKVKVFPHHHTQHLWDRLMRESGITACRLHDCRHTFASRLVMAGIPLNTVRELLGHSDMRTTLRYAHLSPDNLREAVNVL